MSLPSAVALIAGLCALALTVGSLVARPRSIAQGSFVLGMLALGLESLFQYLSLSSELIGPMLRWQRASVVALAAAPASWLVFSLTYSRGDARAHLRRWLPLVLVLCLVPPLLAIGQWSSVITDVNWTRRFGNWVFPGMLPGRVFRAVVLVAAVMILMNLECTFRAAVGTARWRIKHAVIGMVLLFGTRIYTSSQAIVYSEISGRLMFFNSVALTLCCVLVSVSIYRSRLSRLDVYPSFTALHKSLTVILAGIYLLAVGLFAKIVETIGGDAAFPIKALLILIAIVGLGLLWFSDRVQKATKRFVSRHFGRPAYDYRSIWTTFTQKTSSQLDRTEFARAAVKLLAETFDALSVSCWVTDAIEGRLVRIAATSPGGSGTLTGQGAEAVLRGLGQLAQSDFRPINLDRGGDEWFDILRDLNPSQFPNGGHRFCLPLIAGTQLEGMIVLGDRVGGAALSAEDLDLFKCLGDQIAAHIQNLNLSEKLVEAKELEAFQAMSAFLIHDLKNTASALGLTLKNMPQHFDKPEFREDALRTLSKSVERVNGLITRLTSLRQKLELNRAPADLNQVVAAALQMVDRTPNQVTGRELGSIPTFPMDAGKIESVLVNLLINAREASSNGGEVRVETGQHESWAYVAVHDKGCGMSPEFISESLFKPFRTSKRNGLGIGLFQSKAIVEAHGGRITVQSEPAAGTTFKVWLPMSGPNGADDK